MLAVVSPALTSFAASVSGGLSSGFFEALLATPTPLPALLVGQTGLRVRLGARRGSILLIDCRRCCSVSMCTGLRLPEALLLFGLVVAAYAGIGLLAAAFVVSFRTNATIPQAVLVLSTVLGGVYFPTSVLPPAVAPLAEWIPLTPGLRALRQTLLLGYPLSAAAGDLVRLVVARGRVSRWSGSWCCAGHSAMRGGRVTAQY